MSTQQTDLLAKETFAPVFPIKLVRKNKEKNDFQPVILAEAPAAVVGMPEGTLEEKIAKAIAILKWAMQRWEICFSYSGGKDSSTVLSLGLAAAAQLRGEGLEVKRFLVLNSDTLVENPEVLAVVRLELSRIRAWIEKHALPGFIEVTHPSILSQWAVSIIGGKTLISTPQTNRNCTTDLKSIPLGRVRTQFFGPNKVPQGKFTLGVTGVRFSESAERASNMSKRAESATQAVQTNSKQDVFLAPIADWQTDDVMEYIGLAVNDMLPVAIYSDFKDVWRIYKDAEGECTVGRGDKPSAGCGARHGCFVCSMVTTDKSMDAMLTQSQYEYMQPLARFREYLNNTLSDLSLRTWVGRTIEDGHIVFGPDAYSPAYTQDLLRYALTIDRDEQLAAAELGIEPRFRLVSEKALIAIDAVWSLQAYALPHTALAIYHDVYVKGLRFEVPNVPKAPKTPLPARRYIPVAGWDEHAPDAFTGLRNPLLELAEGPCAATRELETKGELRTVMAVQTDDLFTVHEESVQMLMTFEFERLVAKHQAAVAATLAVGFGMAGEGYKFYLQYGAISLAKPQVAKADAILRRSSWREQHGLAGYNYDHDKALAMSVEKLVRQTGPTPDELHAKAQAKALAARRAAREAVRERRLTLGQLYRQWSPMVPWRQLLGRELRSGKLFAHCLQKTKPAYATARMKGWAIHHFVRQGVLVEFLKANPDVAELVKAHRAVGLRKGSQLNLFAA